MNREAISNVIVSKFREKEMMKDLELDQDVFDLGVSSLTIVELQIVVEKELGLEVQTSVLMAAPTMAEWIEIYQSKFDESVSLANA